MEKRHKEINSLLTVVLAQLEKDKPKLQLDKDNDKVGLNALSSTPCAHRFFLALCAAS